jgi:hypothetical protein
MSGKRPFTTFGTSSPQQRMACALLRQLFWHIVGVFLASEEQLVYCMCVCVCGSVWVHTFRDLCVLFYAPNAPNAQALCVHAHVDTWVCHVQHTHTHTHTHTYTYTHTHIHTYRDRLLQLPSLLYRDRRNLRQNYKIMSMVHQRVRYAGMRNQFTTAAGSIPISADKILKKAAHAGTLASMDACMASSQWICGAKVLCEPWAKRERLRVRLWQIPLSVCLSVCLSICLSVTNVRHKK